MSATPWFPLPGSARPAAAAEAARERHRLPSARSTRQSGSKHQQGPAALPGPVAARRWGRDSPMAMPPKTSGMNVSSTVGRATPRGIAGPGMGSTTMARALPGSRSATSGEDAGM
eukprot:scaffold5038_cov112-Isochrysis_galbana.AAC.4